MSKANKKGRSRGGGRFVQLHHYVMESEAWRSLTTQDRAVYIEILALYDGKNNGYIALGARAAGERANVNKDTAAACLKRLTARGFIECAVPGGYGTKQNRATEWRLTHQSCNRTNQPGSRAFLRWRPDLEASPLKPDRASPETGQQVAEIPAAVPSYRTARAV
jgi:hypothetical protein